MASGIGSGLSPLSRLLNPKQFLRLCGEQALLRKQMGRAGHNTTNWFIHAYDKLVPTVGVANRVVVETKNAVSLAHKSSVQDVKKVVNMIKGYKRHEHMHRREAYPAPGLLTTPSITVSVIRLNRLP